MSILFYKGFSAIDLNKQNAEVVIINQEHNRIKLQEHLNKQHNRINKGVNKLMNDASQLAINIKYPVKILKNIINIIASSDNIPHQKKLDTINKLKKLEAKTPGLLKKNWRSESEPIL